MSDIEHNPKQLIESLNNSIIRTDITKRIELLKLLRDSLKKHEDTIFKAMFTDIHRNAHGTSLCELVPVYSEIDYFIKHIKKLASPRNRDTDLMFTPSKSKIVPTPKGKAYIISPFNYPIILTISPLVGSIAAGNASLIRMSGQTPNVFAAVKTALSALPSDIVQVIDCSHSVSDELCKSGFDIIFYTGSPSIGKHIMKLASETLTPVVLELGGKSPLYIHKDCEMKEYIKKMVWGKSFNAGQTCVAPDYVLIDRSRVEEFKTLVEDTANMFWPKGCLESDDFGRLVSTQATNRVGEILAEGKQNFPVFVHKNEEVNEKDRFVPFSCIYFDNLKQAMNSKAMQEEIFGPVWPVIAVDSVDEAINYINKNEKPLALYVFTPNKAIVDRFTYETDSGALVSNDTLIHVANHHIPFGGVGNSGMGQYHGDFSFDAFSHMKPVMLRSGSKAGITSPVRLVTTKIDSSVRMPPYSEDSVKALKHFSK